MSRLTDCATWQALIEHHARIKGVHMRTLFAEDPHRFDTFSENVAGLLVDFSKHRINSETLKLLTALADERGLAAAIRAMFNGEKINNTEGRAALHVALRNAGDLEMQVDGADVMPAVNAVLEKMRTFSEQVRNGDWLGHSGKAITDIVNIGIGGSDLGPAMVCEALRPYASSTLCTHFVSNVDATQLTETLKPLDPQTTLFVIASKTFTTQETLTNALSARHWLLGSLHDEAAIAKHFVAVSTHRDRVIEFGIDPNSMFEFWDWVGGRYSLWSAIGLPIMLSIGADGFDALCKGAHAMDMHFLNTPLQNNVPVILGLLDVWYINFFDARAKVVLPYDQYLHRLPAYLQQADMESLGKSVTRDGEVVDYATGAVVFGESGTNGQHAFYQLLYQGTQIIPADFIAPMHSHNTLGDHHPKLIANCLAQAEALMLGRTEREAREQMQTQGISMQALEAVLPYRVFEGNRPSTTILMDKVTPATLGALIALYEHRIYTQSVVWGLNAFDQWGVELGKQLADKILTELTSESSNEHDGSTKALIKQYRFSN